MGLKDVLGQVDVLALFCFAMALLSWLLPLGMTVIWVLVGLLYQLNRAEGIKASMKGMLAPKPKAVVAPVAPVAA